MRPVGREIMIVAAVRRPEIMAREEASTVIWEMGGVVILLALRGCSGRLGLSGLGDFL